MPDLTELSDDARKLALDRYRKLAPHLEQNISLKQVAFDAALPIRTARRWVHRYKTFGLAGLTRLGRADNGKRRAIGSALLRATEGLALQKPGLSAAAIHREICKAATTRGERLPGYHSIYRAVRSVPTTLRSLAHDGEKSYANTYDLIYRREATRSNEIWQADHTQLDLWARRDDGEIARPWLTVVIDDHSRMIAGFLFMFESPSAAQTALALRQAIWRKSEPHWIVCGIPETLYTDNGSDFTSTHLEQVAAELKTRLIFSIPGHPRGRGKVERFFGTVNQMFLCTLPGYIDGGATRGEPTLALSDLDRRFREFLREYHARPHSETKFPPSERWRRDGFLPRMPESLEQLDLLLLTVPRTRIVRPDGIRFQGMRYIDPVLAAYVGETVLLRYDPRDIAEIRLFHKGKFLCRAICPEIAGQTVALRDIRKARTQRRHELRQTLKERRAAVDALLDLRRGETLPFDQGETAAETAFSNEPPLKRYLNE